jgi:hypothetical protein
MIVEQLGGTIAFKNHTNFDKQPKEGEKPSLNHPLEQSSDDFGTLNRKIAGGNQLDNESFNSEEVKSEESQGLSVILQFPIVTCGEDDDYDSDDAKILPRFKNQE